MYNQWWCFIAIGSKVYRFGRPFDVLVAEPIKQQNKWIETRSISVIKKSGVEVKPPHTPEPGMYVCAVPEWGPGKLVVWADNDFACYVTPGLGRRPQRYNKGYQILTSTSATKYSLSSVEYNLDLLEVINNRPVHMARAKLVNRDNNDQLIHHTLTYSKTSSSEWSTSNGLELGTSMTISAGIPEIFDYEWEISATSSYEHSTGEGTEETVEVSLEAEVTVPPKSRCVIEITARAMQIDVPYEADIVSKFPDGKTHKDHLVGTYRGLSISEDTLEVSECVPIEDMEEYY